MATYYPFQHRKMINPPTTIHIKSDSNELQYVETKKPMTPLKEIADKHINSAIIGFWRMGNVDAVIAAVVGCSLDRVFNTIKTYKDIKGIK